MKTILCVLLTAPTLLAADPPQVTRVTAIARGDTTQFNVTLRHGDTGWDHYADLWEVRGMDGTVLGQRVLLHPHVNEQPFTRSVTLDYLPPATTKVLVFARDNLGFWSTSGFELTLP